jgi:Glu-tRNA(Gln) amidotransferase subunit E-like FAD-binding protein
MDYSKIGLKSGIEIHQQLDTGKLFSRTPSLLRSDEPDFVVERKLHAVAGEEGEVDIAVKHEASLNKKFIYQGYNDTISLVELDESPPEQIDNEALNEALKIALLLNCEIYQHSQIMRKTVIDGSNTSGFQRTVLIGKNGFVETSFGKVEIESLVLEEDACRIISRNEKEVVYRLDRLGIPLIEIATAPVLDTPEKIKETALKIGEILRACKVKRGIGTIRQDVNISIKGHERVEIKGFQDPKIMIKTIDKEIDRQLKDIEQGEVKGNVRNVLSDGSSEFLRPMPGRDRMYPETDLPLLYISRERINEIKKELPKVKSEIKEELSKKGLSAEMIGLLLNSKEIDEFENLCRIYDKNSNLIVKMILLWRNELGKKNNQNFEKVKEILDENVLEEILLKLVKFEIKEEDVKGIMEKILKGGKLEEIKVEKISDDEIEEYVRKIIKEKSGLRANAYMGLVMKEFQGKVDARKAMEIINKILQ